MKQSRTAAMPFVAAGGAKDALTLVRAQKFAATSELLSLLLAPTGAAKKRFATHE
jgi:hypothetical protein